MGLGLRTNLVSLDTQKHLKQTTGRLNQTFERLSSGLRVNRSADDAAGLGIAEVLRGDSRVASVSIRNANDGISLISIADGALDQISNILNRLLELAQQSASASYGNSQRVAIQEEYLALTSEIERLALTTEYNGFKLLSAGDSIGFQVGFDGSSISSVSFSGVQATLGQLGLAQAGTSVMMYSLLGATDVESQSAARLTIEALKTAVLGLNSSRGALGAAQSRLEMTIRSLQVSRESMQSTQSVIMDADVAEESAEMSRLTIQQQAAAAMLAQANVQPRMVLELLRD
jgi:flagellin